MALININPRLTAEENFRAILTAKGLSTEQADEVIASFATLTPVEPGQASVWKDSNASADVSLTTGGSLVTGKVYWKRVEPLPAWVDNLVLKVPQSAGATVDTLLAAVLTSHESIGLVKDFEVSDATIVRPPSVEDALSNGIVINAQANSKVYFGSDVLKVIASFAGIDLTGNVAFKVKSTDPETDGTFNYIDIPANNQSTVTLSTAIIRKALIDANYSVTTFSAEDLDRQITIGVAEPVVPGEVVISGAFADTSEYQGSYAVKHKQINVATLVTPLADEVLFSYSSGYLQLILSSEQKQQIRQDEITVNSVLATALVAKLGNLASYLTLTPDAKGASEIVLTGINPNFLINSLTVHYDLNEIIAMPLMLNGFGETLVLEDLSGFDVA